MPYRKPTLRGTGEAVRVLSNVYGSLPNMISWDTPLKRSSDVRSPLIPSHIVNCRCVPAILQINIDWSRGGSKCPNKYMLIPLTQKSRKYATPQETVHKWPSWNPDISRLELEDSLIVLFSEKRVKEVTWSFNDKKKCQEKIIGQRETGGERLLF